MAGRHRATSRSRSTVKIWGASSPRCICRCGRLRAMPYTEERLPEVNTEQLGRRSRSSSAVFECSSL